MTTTRRLAAIVSADVAGYSRLMEGDEAGTLATLKRHREELIDRKIGQYGGRVVGTAGDGQLIEFGSVVDAVQCAVEVQQGMDERNAEVAAERRMELRVGVNLGDVIVDGADIHGDGVNVAARLQQLATPGGVCIAGTVREHIAGKLPYTFDDAGEQQVKNIARAVRVFRLRRDRPGGAVPAPVQTEDLPLPSKPSVAVLPFTNMSGDPEQEYFSDGITEDIITELSRHRGLFVIARNSSFVFKGPATDIGEVGRKLGVRYVVEGSVRKAGKRIRITAQLVEAATGNHVWAERYDRDLEDIFSVQDEVTERIVWALAGRMTLAEIEQSKRKRMANPGAYDLVLRGMDLVMNSAMEDMGGAIHLFEEATRLDPTSGKATAWLAMALWHASYEVGKYEVTSIRAADMATRALRLDDPEDWTELIIGYVCAKNGDFQTAMVHMNRAMARNPSSTWNLTAKSYILLWHGYAEEALEIGEKLQRLDPLDLVWYDALLAYANYLLGNYQISFEHFRREMPLRWNPDYAYVAACLGQLGRTEEARAMWRKALELMPGFSHARWMEISAFRDPGYREHWLDGLRRAGITE